jgi:LIVCS family branched-chain amino acid:cation transporter
MYLIIIALPAPRTAAVTHEMAVAPILGTEAIWTSLIYFGLVFLFVVNRSQALNILGKYLTPLIVFMVLLIILIGVISPAPEMRRSTMDAPFVDGLLEGYQTYDALAGMVMGGVIIISLNKSGNYSYDQKRRIIAKSGLVAMFGLFAIYAGLIAIGAFYNNSFPEDITRTDLLLGLATQTLGNIGATFVGVLVALACFTTAVAIIVSIADFFEALFNHNHKIYVITTVICCLTGIIVGSFDVGFIIYAAIPALMLLYPISIALIILNIVPDHWASPLVFRTVIFTTFLFSLPDILKFFLGEDFFEPIISYVPLAQHNLGWVIPSVTAFVVTNAIIRFKPYSKS